MYKVDYKGYEFNITQNEDGTFNIPEDIRDLEPFGTALKPAAEYIVVARKPLSEKSVALNVLKWGTGGINIDGCRVGTELISHGTSKMDIRGKLGDFHTRPRIEVEDHITEGRFPANIILECCCDEVIKGEKGERTTKETNINNKDANWFRNAGGDKEERWSFNDKGDIHTNPMCPCYMMDEQSGVSKSSPTPSHIRKGNVVGDKRTSKSAGMFGDGNMLYGSNHNDKGGSSRFFYQAKVSKAERNMGLDGFEEKQVFGDEGGTYQGLSDSKIPSKNHHATVKPVNLMAYLCRLVTPPNGIVLDPFMGSGSTGIAAQLEGFRFVGMELDEDYFKIAEARIEAYEQYRKFIK
jgi:site-specific DNA-methyltransferase (adenine-specific)